MPLNPKLPRLASGALLWAAAFSAAPLAAEVKLLGDSGFVSRHEVIVSAQPTAVWLALISPSGWWQSQHTWSGEAANLTLTPQAGGCFCERIPEVEERGRLTLEGSVEHMRVVQAYPERALRMRGALGPLQSEPVDGVLTIVISTTEQGTRIVWEYNVGGTMRYELPVIATAVDGVMGAQLAALASTLGPVAMPQATAPLPGDDPATVPQADDGARPGTAPAQAPQIKPSAVDEAFGDLGDGPPR
jgi:hypothetical protein